MRLHLELLFEPEERFGLLADLSGTYRAIWVALAIVLLVAFLPALAIRESA